MQHSQKNRSSLITSAAGGMLTILIALAFQHLVGSPYSDQHAQQLLDPILSSSHYLSSAILGATATILALMLTLLSMGHKIEKELSNSFYGQIKLLSYLSVITIITAALFLQMNSLPVIEAGNVSPALSFKTLYFMSIGFSSVLAGLMVSITILLLDSILKLIEIIA